MSKAIVLIPARFQSSRFPGKPLALIAGQPMIERVYKNVIKSGFNTYVVTDDERIKVRVEAFGGKVLFVPDDVPSGSERIALAAERFLAKEDAEFIINVQGDEPLLDGETLKRLVEYHSSTEYGITTIVKARSRNDRDWENPNVVKAVLGKYGKCIYFSRASVPYLRDLTNAPWFQHIGVYCFRPKVLQQFVKYPMGILEDMEKLEQLRALENGIEMGAIETDLKLIGVDVPDDVKKVEEALRE